MNIKPRMNNDEDINVFGGMKITLHCSKIYIYFLRCEMRGDFSLERLRAHKSVVAVAPRALHSCDCVAR